jgi:hypothetical protein
MGVLTAFLMVFEFLALSQWADKRVAAAVSQADSDADKPLIIGDGVTLKAKGVELMVGQLAIDKRSRTGSMPVFVSQNQGGYALQCILTDERGALLGGGGIAIPPKLSAPTLTLSLNRDATAKSKLGCSLVKL